MAQIDLKKATIVISDGGVGTAKKSITIKVGEGNLTWNERRNMEYTLDRGIIDEVREGDQVPLEVSFDFVWEYLKGAAGTGATPTIYEAIKGIGNASAWVSTDADTCRPKSVDLVVTYDPECGTGNTETITFPDFRWEELSPDLRAGTISCSGRCNALSPTSIRS